VFTGNWAQFGGGVYADASSSTLANTVVAANQASISGSGIYVRRSSPRLLHTTLAGNTGGDGSGICVSGYVDFSSSVALTNTILAGQTTGITVMADSEATLDGVLWSGNGTNAGGPGAVTISNETTGDPAFGADGYHLLPSSAAIERGVSAGVLADIDGDVRPQGLLPDLGADEVNTVLPVGGGAINPAAGVTMTLEGATFPDAIVVDFTPRPATGTGALSHVGLFYDLDARYVSTGQPAQVPAGNHYGITVTYLQANVPAGVREADLALYSWDGSRWITETSSTVDAGANTITAWPDHFSLWAALAEPLPYRIYLPAILR
jgi:hypothetical protein